MDYISIEEFAKRYSIKPKTVEKNIEKIEGVKKKNGEILILDTSRYPFFKKNISIETRDDKKYLILRATYENKYVDKSTVGCSKASFQLLVNELLEMKYLQLNGCDDENGLNKYDVTDLVSRVIKEKKKKGKIMRELFVCVGAFVGAATAAYNRISK